MDAVACGRIPYAVKGAHTAFVVVLVPVYARRYGPGNFLWFSDVALLASVPALWLESPLLASTQAVGVLVPETLWLLDFGAGIVAGRHPIGLASYMFDRRIPRLVRGLSLFHLWLTPLLLLVISRAGYDRRAFKYQTVVTWVILLASWRLTRPKDNVNWVYSQRARIRSRAARAGFVALLMVSMPLLFHLPAHRFLARVFDLPPKGGSHREKMCVCFKRPAGWRAPLGRLLAWRPRGSVRRRLDGRRISPAEARVR